jgi:hypothetical protein
MRIRDWALVSLMTVSPGVVAQSVTVSTNLGFITPIDQSVDTIGSLSARYARDPSSLVYWYRKSRVDIQSSQISDCAEKVSQLTRSINPSDIGLVRPASEYADKMISLVDSMQPTGRYAIGYRLNAVDLAATPIMASRKLRDHDHVDVISDYKHVVWAVNLVDGVTLVPHGPLKRVKDYALSAVQAGHARGDFAYVIYPHGEVVRVGIAAHNESDTYPSPWSIMFFPPPGFGPTDQEAFECVSELFAFQRIYADGVWQGIVR